MIRVGMACWGESESQLQGRDVSCSQPSLRSGMGFECIVTVRICV